MICGRDDQIGRVAHENVHLVHIQELGVDAGHSCSIGLVVIVDQLDRAAEQAALGVDLLYPDLFREKMRLAGRGKAAG